MKATISLLILLCFTACSLQEEDIDKIFAWNENSLIVSYKPYRGRIRTDITKSCPVLDSKDTTAHKEDLYVVEISVYDKDEFLIASFDSLHIDCRSFYVNVPPIPISEHIGEIRILTNWKLDSLREEFKGFIE